MYLQKPKRVRDPSLPPPPTLLGHDKIIRDTNATIENLKYQLDKQHDEIEKLKRKLYAANYRIDLLSKK